MVENNVENDDEEPDMTGREVNRWEAWDGWIPNRDVVVERTTDEEVFANVTRDLGHRLYLGRTLAGRDFHIEGQDLEKVNVITGVKGGVKSHLSKVILLQLIAQGAPCIVFDINKEYIHLPKVETDATGKVQRRGIIHLEAGGIPFWIMTIQDEHLSPGAKAQVEQFREECAKALMSSPRMVKATEEFLGDLLS